MAAFFYGLVVGKYEVFPYQQLKAAKHLLVHREDAKFVSLYDEYGRLSEITGKTELPYPVQTERTGIPLVIGQSSGGNSAEKLVHTRFPERNWNFFNGRCYVSGSLLLGATSRRGEWLTLLGDQLIEQGMYDNIVLIPSAIGGSVIAGSSSF